MHRPPPIPRLPAPVFPPTPKGSRPPGNSQAGFSLVEVTLAIGIIAFAFVALFGLLPTGLQTFRAAIDTTNDTVMLQDMNSMVQVTPWKEMKSLEEDIFYFDEEGRRTDSEKNKNEEVKDRRLYQVKLLIEDLDQPGAPGKKLAQANRVTVVVGDVLNKKSKTDFESVTKSNQIKGSSLAIRSRTFLVTNMDSEK